MARRDKPPFAASAMDGYALRAGDRVLVQGERSAITSLDRFSDFTDIELLDYERLSEQFHTNERMFVVRLPKESALADVTLEKSRLAVSFELEADRMRNLHLQDEEFRKEIKVVMEERRLRTEDKPTALTYEQFNATAFTSSSARIPTIGWMNDLDNMQLDDLQDWYQRWEENGYFSPSGQGDTSYCIMIPPPNVTGSLHMGHGFNNAIMDALIRFRRMQGRNTLWQPGTDHAGIATQMVVERQLAAEGTDRHELGREKFVDRVWQWKEESGNTITRQLRRLGSSIDWSRERFTMDEGLSRAVEEVFIRLYDEGLIYRDRFIVNWCPRCHTAISEIEVEHEDVRATTVVVRRPVSVEQLVRDVGLDRIVGAGLDRRWRRPRRDPADRAGPGSDDDRRGDSGRDAAGGLLAFVFRSDDVDGIVVPELALAVEAHQFGTGAKARIERQGRLEMGLGRRPAIRIRPPCGIMLPVCPTWNT